MLKWIGRFFLLLLICPVLWGLMIGTLNYAGVCRNPWGVLSEEEKIRLTLNQINSSEFLQVSRECISKNNHCRNIPYKNVDELLQKNPDCCGFAMHKDFGGLYPVSTFDLRIMGEYAGSVGVRYIAHYLNDEGKEKSFLLNSEGTSLHISNCGEPTNF